MKLDSDFCEVFTYKVANESLNAELKPLLIHLAHVVSKIEYLRVDELKLPQNERS